MKTQTSLNILVLEDDLYICKKMSSVLSQYGRVFTANTSKNWKFILETYPIDVAFIDLNLTKGDKLEGLSVVKYCNVNNIYPVVVTNKDDYDVKVRAFRLGAKKYFLKSKIIKNLDIVMGPLLRTLAFDQLDDWIINDFCTQDSTIISKIQDFKEKGVPHDLKLLISGPPGVKKQKVAKLLYKMSRDSRAPFVKLNILQIPPKKHLEAVKDALKKSLNGLLLVKHVNKLSKDAQTFLVSSYPENKNLQLVFTSDIDLFPAIQSNLISKDFYDLFLRNNFQIPSLKNRKKDIDLVVRGLMTKSMDEIAFSSEALELILNNDWSRNVEDIENIFKYLKGKKGFIQVDDLPDNIKSNQVADDQLKEVLTDQQLSMIHQVGIDAFIETVEQEYFTNCMQKFENKTTKCREYMGVGTPRFQRILRSWKTSGVNYVQ